MDGVWNPVLVVWAPNYRGEPARVRMNLNVCELHRRQTNLEELLTDTMWAFIDRTITDMGKVRPDRRLTNLDFVKADDNFFNAGGGSGA
jgi:hypothetical protein